MNAQIITHEHYIGKKNYPKVWRAQNIRAYQPNSYTCGVKRFLKEYGFPADLHLHSLRNMAITRAVESGMNLRDIQKYIGHSRIEITEPYAHDSLIKPFDINFETGE